jgi:putative hydrolase of the HAD superfamily
MPLTAVTFDLWQTLILDSPELSGPRRRLLLDGTSEVLREEGFDYPEDQVTAAYRQCQADGNEVRAQEGDISFDEQIDTFLGHIDDELLGRLSAEGRVRVARRYADAYLERPPQVDEHSETVLRTLSNMGLKLAMICNTGSTPGATQRVFLERKGLLRYFETLTFSDEERLSKPAAKIFHDTLRRLDAEPFETLHVGDHPRNDIAGAKRAGLGAVWIRRRDEETEVEPDAAIDSLDQLVGAISRLMG